MMQLLQMLKGLDPKLISKIIAAVTQLQAEAGEMKLEMTPEGEGRERLMLSTVFEGEPVTLAISFPTAARTNLGF